jgi:hypothetical protein
MKKSNFVARLSKGAMASGVVGACLIPQRHSAEPNSLSFHADAAVVDRALIAQDDASHSSISTDTFFISVKDPVQEWTPALEREFRKLALEELKGTIQPDGMHRLEVLNDLRNRLQDPLSPHELLLQIRRDRVLAKMADALNDYAKFHEGADQARRAAKQTH